MGNRPSNRTVQQPYHTMVEDAVLALKERPGSTQADIFKYLESKYQGRIPPKLRKSLQVKLRSVLKSRRGRPSSSSSRSRRSKLKRKSTASRKLGKRRGPGRPPASFRKAAAYSRSLKKGATRKLKRLRRKIARKTGYNIVRLPKLPRLKSQKLAFSRGPRMQPKLHYRPIACLALGASSPKLRRMRSGRRGRLSKTSSRGGRERSLRSYDMAYEPRKYGSRDRDYEDDYDLPE